MRRRDYRATIAKAFLITIFMAAAGSAAADNRTEDKWRHACWRDAFSMCTLSAIGGDRPAVRDCLLRNIERISPACRTVIREAHDQGVKGVTAPEDPAPPRSNISH